MKRHSVMVNRTTKACADVVLDMCILAGRMEELSESQIQNLAQQCFVTRKELRESEKAFDREFNKRIGDRLRKSLTGLNKKV